MCVERLLHIGSHFSLRKWRWRPHFLTKLAAAASFSYKIGGGGLIFLQNWRRRQGFGNITGGVLTWSGYWNRTHSSLGDPLIVPQYLVMHSRQSILYREQKIYNDQCIY